MEYESENPAVRLHIDALDAMDALVDKLDAGKIELAEAKAEMDRIAAKVKAAMESMGHRARIVKADPHRAGGK
jgi:hypothetical protein